MIASARFTALPCCDVVAPCGFFLLVGWRDRALSGFRFVP